MTFATAVPILFTSFVYYKNVYRSVIHGIKLKLDLSVLWNWYHFVAIAILHQPRPTESPDMKTWLQLSDTSSIPPMHGGFLLIARSFIIWYCIWYGNSWVEYASEVIVTQNSYGVSFVRIWVTIDRIITAPRCALYAVYLSTSWPPPGIVYKGAPRLVR